MAESDSDTGRSDQFTDVVPGMRRNATLVNGAVAAAYVVPVAAVLGTGACYLG